MPQPYPNLTPTLLSLTMPQPCPNHALCPNHAPTLPQIIWVFAPTMPQPCPNRASVDYQVAKKFYSMSNIGQELHIRLT